MPFCRLVVPILDAIELPKTKGSIFFLLANSIGPYDYRMLLAIIFALATSICTARRSSSTVGKAFVREPGGEGLVTLVIGPYLYPSGQWVMELHMIWEQTIWNLSDGPDSGCVSNCLKSTKNGWSCHQCIWAFHYRLHTIYPRRNNLQTPTVKTIRPSYLSPQC